MGRGFSTLPLGGPGGSPPGLGGCRVGSSTLPLKKNEYRHSGSPHVPDRGGGASSPAAHGRGRDEKKGTGGKAPGCEALSRLAHELDLLFKNFFTVRAKSGVRVERKSFFTTWKAFPITGRAIPPLLFWVPTVATLPRGKGKVNVRAPL
jgi:hypothetical protein